MSKFNSNSSDQTQTGPRKSPTIPKKFKSSNDEMTLARVEGGDSTRLINVQNWDHSPLG